jgi:cytidine deaminase
MPPSTISQTTRTAMLNAARAAREKAYAPYSKFLVGAAVLDEHGHIHAGCNVENAAYPQGVCAEASALSVMIMGGGRKAVAVVVVGVADSPVTPCGGCRQKLREFAAPDTPIWIANAEGVLLTLTLDQLLPHSFGPEHLAL